MTETEARALIDALGAPDCGTSDSAVLLESLAQWSAERRCVLESALALLPPARRHLFIEALLVQSSPLGLSLGCWLQGMSAPGVFENEGHLLLLAIYADDVGVGRPYGARSDEFLRILQRLNHPVGDARAFGLAQCAEVEDAMFALPCVLMAMSRRSDIFHPEICAFDLVLRSIGLLPGWAVARDHHRHPADWNRLDLARSGDSEVVTNPCSQSLKIASHYMAGDDEPAVRFRGGLRSAIAGVGAWDALLLELASAASDPCERMAGVVRRKAREAAVYHKQSSLNGCPMSSHFEGAAADPWPLVEALAASRYVRPGDPGRSPLVNGLVSAQGPMFRVFPPRELDDIRAWIDQLPALERAIPKARAAQPLLWTKSAPDVERGFAPSGIREAYFLLQGRALAPATRSYAMDYATRWLVNAGRAKANCERSLPECWPQHGLREWLLAQHDLHGRAFEDARKDSVPAKEDVIASTLQLAPLILIDGAWLQGFTDINQACSEVGRPLFETFWDELGNGKIALNHPKIYRDLLASMDVRLAATGSWDFASDTRIRDDSFRLPVYWLCLGKLPLTFMPEILGLNLAMELSGVGDGYREARRFLMSHGFSTHFVDLHNTIDNVATGHSAWAADAIDRYMTPYRGDKLSDDRWLRIRVGYASLSATPARRTAGSWLASLLHSRVVPAPTPASAMLHYDFPLQGLQ